MILDSSHGFDPETFPIAARAAEGDRIDETSLCSAETTELVITLDFPLTAILSRPIPHLDFVYPDPEVLSLLLGLWLKLF